MIRPPSLPHDTPRRPTPDGARVSNGPDRLPVRSPTIVADPTRPKHLPRPFTDEEVARLLALELPPMERALRAVLFGSGLRATPICGLGVGDVNESPPQLRALMKGSKVQVVTDPAGAP